MSDYQSDAFVFFGATGDLAYKKTEMPPDHEPSTSNSSGYEWFRH